MAAARPGEAALKVPHGRARSGDIDYLTLSFAALLAETDAWCARLKARGIARGDRALVMVRPGLPLIASAFALFKIGAVPVIIDPGMGIRNFLSCVERSRPRALVGIPIAQVLSRVFMRAFRSVEVRVPVSGSHTATIRGTAPAIPHPAAAAAGDLAAILFTSGSTGPPKGVCYEHGMFDAQVGLIRETYGIQPGEIDLPLLPIFALFNPALGMTSIIPEIDPRHPAKADPGKIVQAILQEKVTNSFGSPTIWGKVAQYCGERAIELPTLRRVLCAGAPVPAGLWDASRSFLKGGRLHSPYGATEALPVSTVSGDEIEAGSTRGACVGRPVRGIDVRIISISDHPIPALAPGSALASGCVGEIIVRGPVVTRQYDALPEATASAKIADPDVPGGIWHRMGDCGTLDDNGRLWFLGRKAERVETPEGRMYTEPCEQVFRTHPRARRCALIGVAGGPALVAETAIRGKSDASSLAAELRKLALAHPHTAPIGTFYFKAHFPVDVRHNAKIHRLALATWAAHARAFQPD
jgi:acyl-CoA synthetase (AMP-forming)/AMP-acid ligase II